MPPLQCFDTGEAEVPNEVFDAFGYDRDGRGQAAATHFAGDGAERGAVEVVHVRMRQEQGVDGRQVGYADAGTALAAEQDEAGGKNGVDEQGAAGGLDEEGRVADEGDGGIAGGDPGRPGWGAGERLRVALAYKTPELREFARPEGEFRERERHRH